MPESKIIMSEELQGLIPELEDDTASEYGSNAVVQFDILDQKIPLRGPLVSVTSSQAMEFEIRSTIEAALAIYKIKNDVIFDKIKIIYHEESLTHEGPFMISDIKIHDIKHSEQICVLKMSLKLANKQ